MIINNTIKIKVVYYSAAGASAAHSAASSDAVVSSSSDNSTTVTIGCSASSTILTLLDTSMSLTKITSLVDSILEISI
jgi:hypothetical protein